jgi:hypothetical protein
MLVEGGPEGVAGADVVCWWEAARGSESEDWGFSRLEKSTEDAGDGIWSYDVDGWCGGRGGKREKAGKSRAIGGIYRRVGSEGGESGLWGSKAEAQRKRKWKDRLIAQHRGCAAKKPGRRRDQHPI